MTTLLGEQKYFYIELESLIHECNERLRKAFNIQRVLLRIEEKTQLETDTLQRTKKFIRFELDFRKGHQNKLNKAKFINN